jgi:DnaJ-domain-containing protein 1
MGIWNRLGDVIKSYLNDEDRKIFGNGGGYSATGDPDMDAAFDELNEFLSGGGTGSSGWSGGEDGGRTGAAVPESLRPDFAELGVAFGAPADKCKAAYKGLLKIHHPDRHAGHPGNFKKATEKTARINAAYDRIERWRAGLN